MCRGLGGRGPRQERQDQRKDGDLYREAAWLELSSPAVGRREGGKVREEMGKPIFRAKGPL